MRRTQVPCNPPQQHDLAQGSSPPRRAGSLGRAKVVTPRCHFLITVKRPMQRGALMDSRLELPHGKESGLVKYADIVLHGGPTRAGTGGSVSRPLSSTRLAAPIWAPALPPQLTSKSAWPRRRVAELRASSGHGRPAEGGCKSPICSLREQLKSQSRQAASGRNPLGLIPGDRCMLERNYATKLEPVIIDDFYAPFRRKPRARIADA